MKKIIISLCFVILFAGIAYFFYGEKTIGKVKPDIVLDTEVETEIIKKEDIGEVRTDIPVSRLARGMGEIGLSKWGATYN